MRHALVTGLAGSAKAGDLAALVREQDRPVRLAALLALARQRNAAFGQIHTMTEDGKMHGGFYGMRRLLRELPLGFPVWLLLHVPGVTQLGEAIYKFVARNRYRINKMVGAPICENSACRIHAG